MLKLYSSACTTRIVGLAAEECGRLSYHVDHEFDKNELTDPEFPVNTSSDFRYDESSDVVSPVDILTDVCGTPLENIIDTIGKMEERWIHAGFLGSGSFNQHVAHKLWEFVKDHAKYHVQSLYGDEYEKEFERIGDELFLRANSQDFQH
jgi:hypothetical protein